MFQRLRTRGIAYERTKEKLAFACEEMDSVRLGFVLCSLPTRKGDFSICDGPALVGRNGVGGAARRDAPSPTLPTRGREETGTADFAGSDHPSSLLPAEFRPIGDFPGVDSCQLVPRDLLHGAGSMHDGRHRVPDDRIREKAVSLDRRFDFRIGEIPHQHGHADFSI